jgi:tetratricopeptide (TPR) repeat protein
VKKLRIFAASPSDMAVERGKVESVAASLKPLADKFEIVLDVVDWRSAVPDMGRPEDVILEQLAPTEWDVFVGILWHRFGTPPGGEGYLSGTEEEFRTACRLWKASGKPRIMMYRCTRPVPPDDLDPDQFKRVKEFFAQLEAAGEYPGLYQKFETAEAFEKLLIHNLQKIVLSGQTVAPEVLEALAPAIPDNLPRRAPFFGRAKEMSGVLRALSPEDRTWGVLVDGIGGVGKSALALEAAWRCKDEGAFDAWIFVSAKQNVLAPEGIRDMTPAARTLDEFLSETARVLGRNDVPQLESDKRRRAILDALRSTRALLIWDNLETLTKEEQEAAADFLRELPTGCKAVITSRRRGGEGAVWLRLERIEWEGALGIIKNEMERDAGLAAKLRKAGEARWSELHDETKGSPLALMHILGLMRVRPSLTFVGALELLRGNRTPDLQKFIFQEARRELTTNDQAALRALSLFVPSASFVAWMDVASLSRQGLEMAIDRLSALSLVDVLEGEERYTLHPITRNFVRDELLSDAQTSSDVQMRFGKYWTGYVQPLYDDDPNDVAAFQSERPNINAAAELLWQLAGLQCEKLENKDAARMLTELSSAVSELQWSGGFWDELIQLQTQAYTVATALRDAESAGHEAYRLAWVYCEQGNERDAIHWLDRCAGAWGELNDRAKQAQISQLRGVILSTLLNNKDAAAALYKEAMAIFRELNNSRGCSVLLTSMGNLERDRGAYHAAEQYYLEALQTNKAAEEKTGLSVIYLNLGYVAGDLERWSEASEWYQKALSLSRELRDQEGIAMAQRGLARVHNAQGHPELALPLAEEALAIYERLRLSDLPGLKKFVEILRAKVRSVPPA